MQVLLNYFKNGQIFIIQNLTLLNTKKTLRFKSNLLTKESVMEFDSEEILCKVKKSTQLMIQVLLSLEQCSKWKLKKFKGLKK